MQTRLRMVVALIIVLGTILTGSSVRAQGAHVNTDTCQEGAFSTGALWLICIPHKDWNGDVIVFSPGYTIPSAPIDFYYLELPDGTFLPDLAESLGFAFATTSNRQNGLAVLEGADDIRDLVNFFPQVAGQNPGKTYMIGASQGGIVTTLLMEQSPTLLSGGLPMCGAVGDFQRQLNYIGDFRLLFDYFFPNVLPGGPTAVPVELANNWETVYVPQIQQLVANNPGTIDQLIRVSGAVVDPDDPATIEDTVLNLLWYNAFTTNDVVQKLNGNPYENVNRQYSGSANDALLNQRVPRFAADPAARAEVQRYETTGQLTKPMFMLHTKYDQLFPVWHQELYSQKVTPSFRLIQGTPDQYGHCNFAATELLSAFGILVLLVSIDQSADTTTTDTMQPERLTLDTIFREFSRKTGIPVEELHEAKNRLDVDVSASS